MKISRAPLLSSISSVSPVSSGSLLCLVLLACSGPTEPPGELVRAASPRELNPALDQASRAKLIEGHTRFSLSMYAQLSASKPSDNMIFSGHSINTALAMAYAGARGETKAQMAQALQLLLEDEKLHAGFNWLDLSLEQQVQKSPVDLRVVNSLFGHRGYAFLDPFLDTLAVHYDAGMSLLDFKNASEPARQEINRWVLDMTAGRIDELLKEGKVNSRTRLVLVNAVYFNAPWAQKFKRLEGRFMAPSGERRVPMMSSEAKFGYREVDGAQVVAMPYKGEGFEMVLIAPPAGDLLDFEAKLDLERLSALTEALPERRLQLELPTFEITAEFSLRRQLGALGMIDAFDDADFSGIDGTRDLVIQDVSHKAFIKVDERGTEAAAATGVGFEVTSLPSVTPVIIDRPFIYLIRDRATGAILFMGRLIEPV